MKQIYPSIQLFFASAAVSAIGSVLSNIEAISMLANLLTIAGAIMMLVSISRLRAWNDRFGRAFKLYIAYIVMTLVLTGAAVSVVMSIMTGSDMTAIGIAAAVLAVIMMITAMAAQYQTYRGFDELREAYALDYPPRRIMWCFYLMIISSVIGAVTVAVTLVVLLPGLMQVSAGADVSGLTAMAESFLTVSKVTLVIGVALEAVHLWLLYTYMQAAQSAMDHEPPMGWEA